MKPAHRLLFAVAAVVSALSAHAALLIDDFSQNAAGDADFTGTFADVSTPMQSLTQAGLNPANTLGGERELFSSYAGSQNGPNGQAGHGLGDSSGFFQLVNSTAQAGEVATGGITWDGGGTLHADFSGNGGFLLNVSFAIADVAPTIPFSLTVNSASGAATVTKDAAATPAGNNPQALNWSFSEFSGVDFSDVTSLTLFVSATMPANEFLGMGFTDFSAVAVPEPEWTAALTGLALAGFVFARRRRAAR